MLPEFLKWMKSLNDANVIDGLRVILIMLWNKVIERYSRPNDMT